VKFIARGPDLIEQDMEGRETLSSLSLMSGADHLSHRLKSLRILAFSDYHDEQSIPDLIQIAAGRKADLILYGGDAVHRFRAESRNLFEELAVRAKYGVCAVAGNDDRNGKSDIARGENIRGPSPRTGAG
jgi:predicted MPP superfamily phosphohydrolase